MNLAKTTRDSRPLLQAGNITKRFPGVLALHDVSLSLRKGEVLAVIGENGAGKSTLMKILAGIFPPDSGEIFLEGNPVAFTSVQAALELGIVLIHQELNLLDNLDIGSNIFLGREPLRHGLIDNGEIAKRARQELAKVGLQIPTKTIVRNLAIGHRQMVEIAKALSVKARILIMDEPSSSLTQYEIEHLFRAIGDLKSRGVSIIYITHRLGEIKTIADRVLVLRDGRNAGLLHRDGLNHNAMVQLMVGRELDNQSPRQAVSSGKPVLEARDLRIPDNPSYSLNFTIRAGELVGMAGLVGAGRTALLKILFGVNRPISGQLFLHGREVRFKNPGAAISQGIALVPEDRKKQGLILKMSVRENIGLASLFRNRLSLGVYNKRMEIKQADEMITRLDLKTSKHKQTAECLSGGNQQKTVLAKWLALNPKLLLLDEPTRGIDVKAKREIYHIMNQLASQGTAILFISSEMEEILSLSDRVLIMCEGRMAGELSGKELNEEAVMQLATGI